ncbi:hypothetical protein Tco_0111107 [Tanacetum coccineum]
MMISNNQELLGEYSSFKHINDVNLVSSCECNWRVFRKVDQIVLCNKKGALGLCQLGYVFTTEEVTELEVLIVQHRLGSDTPFKSSLGEWKKHKLNRSNWNIGDPHCGGDLVEVTDMSMRDKDCVPYPRWVALEQMSLSSSALPLALREDLPEMGILYEERSKGFSWSWDKLAVSVQCIQGNPSLPFVLTSSQPLKGFVGLSVLPGERVIGALGCGERVWVSWEVLWDSGLAL